MPKTANASLFQYVLTAALMLFRWGAQRLWNILTFWRSERRKPFPDRQKIDRQKAFAGLAAILLAVGAVALFVWRGLGLALSASSAFIDRQTALYVGLALLLIGLNIARLMPQRRKIGLVLAALGGLLVAYGLGHLG